jgi:hypothetical protein
MRNALLPLAGPLFISAFLAAAQLRGIFLVFGPRMRDHVAAAQGITQGLPHWRSFQSRVLGPFFVEALSRLTGLTYEDTYPFAIYLFLLVFFFVLLLVARRLWNSIIAALATALAAFAFNAILMQGLWVYPWDYIDLTVFTLVTWAILAAWPLWLLAFLLLLEVFNRDVVVFLAIWLMVDAFVRLEPSEDSWPRVRLTASWTQCLVAVGLAVIGYAVMEILRDALLVREVGLELFPELRDIVPGVNQPGKRFSLELPLNVRFLRYSFAHPLDSLYVVFNVMVFAIPALGVRALFCKHVGTIRAGFLYCVLWGTTITLALIYETRVWLQFVPFLVLVGPIALGGQPPGLLAESWAQSPASLPAGRRDTD